MINERGRDVDLRGDWFLCAGVDFEVLGQIEKLGEADVVGDELVGVIRIGFRAGAAVGVGRGRRLGTRLRVRR